MYSFYLYASSESNMSSDPFSNSPLPVMNLFYAVATVALALATSVDGEACSQEVQTAAINSMLPLINDPSFVACAKSTGYDILSKEASLSAPQFKATVCNVQSCKDIASKAQSTNPPDCELVNPIIKGQFNMKSLINEFWKTCSETNPEARSATSYSFLNI